MTGWERTAPIVIVAEQRDQGWQVSHVAGGRASAPRLYPSCAWQEQLHEWLGAINVVDVRAVVLLLAGVDGQEYPKTETLLPFPVMSLPRQLALAAFAPADWSAFAVIDGQVGRCGLVTRSDAGRFHYAESATGDACRPACDFGYRRVVAGGEVAAGVFECVQRVPGDTRLAIGAARLGLDALAADGVCRSESVSRPRLRLARRGSAGYDIIHTRGVFDLDNDCLAQVIDGRPVLFAVDVDVLRLHGPAMRRYAKAHIPHCAFATLRAGDAFKSWAQVAYLCQKAERAGLPRHGLIVGLGGGVALDVAGLAASLYHRGTPYLRVPTTLLAMVDVAVGIKQGINFRGRKSLLGAFYPPIGAINDFAFLETLPRSELSNGFSEIVKLGLVRDPLLFRWLEEHGEGLIRSGYQDPAEWAFRIALRAEYVMMADLQPNLYEHDRRRFPDFGHTFSTAIEEATRFAIPHGVAVAADMLLATIIAVRRGICSEKTLEQVVALFGALDLLTVPEACNGEVLAQALRSARQHRGGRIHMVVPRRIGEGSFLDDVTAAEGCAALDRAVEICAAQRRWCASAGD